MKLEVLPSAAHTKYTAAPTHTRGVQTKEKKQFLLYAVCTRHTSLMPVLKSDFRISYRGAHLWAAIIATRFPVKQIHAQALVKADLTCTKITDGCEASTTGWCHDFLLCVCCVHKHTFCGFTPTLALLLKTGERSSRALQYWSGCCQGYREGRVERRGTHRAQVAATTAGIQQGGLDGGSSERSRVCEVEIISLSPICVCVCVFRFTSALSLWEPRGSHTCPCRNTFHFTLSHVSPQKGTFTPTLALSHDSALWLLSQHLDSPLHILWIEKRPPVCTQVGGSCRWTFSLFLFLSLFCQPEVI